LVQADAAIHEFSGIGCTPLFNFTATSTVEISCTSNTSEVGISITVVISGQNSAGIISG
jgi:hypothetical protein